MIPKDSFNLKFPPKKKFGNFENEFLQSRMAALEEILTHLTVINSVFQDEDMQQFLSANQPGDISNAYLEMPTDQLQSHI